MPANSSTFRQVRTISSLLLLALACALAASAGLLAQEKGLSSEKRAQIEKAVSAFRDLMWTVPQPTEGKPSHYALGWFIADKFGVRTASHTGGQQGTDTAFIIVPDRGLGVVVLANMDSVDTNHAADEILKIMLDRNP
jgi:CubicO group peptidase (beta-lactamase class C family)